MSVKSDITLAKKKKKNTFHSDSPTKWHNIQQLISINCAVKESNGSFFVIQLSTRGYDDKVTGTQLALKGLIDNGWPVLLDQPFLRAWCLCMLTGWWWAFQLEWEPVTDRDASMDQLVAGGCHMPVHGAPLPHPLRRCHVGESSWHPLECLYLLHFAWCHLYVHVTPLPHPVC